MREKILRNKKIKNAIDKGMSFREVAKKFKLNSPSTVHQIYHRKEKKV